MMGALGPLKCVSEAGCEGYQPTLIVFMFFIPHFPLLDGCVFFTSNLSAFGRFTVSCLVLCQVPTQDVDSHPSPPITHPGPQRSPNMPRPPWPWDSADLSPWERTNLILLVFMELGPVPPQVSPSRSLPLGSPC